MKESNFQFSDPSLTYLKFKENKNFTIEDGKEIEIGTNINVSNSKFGTCEAAVSLQITLGSEAENSPFYLETEISANFRWTEGLEEEKVDLFISQNAPALLLSYARPIISMTTNASRFPAYNIPFINFTGKN